MGWMRWRDFSGGEMTNWGAHGVDQIQWALGMDGKGPVEIRPLAPAPTARWRCGTPTASRSISCWSRARPDGRRGLHRRKRQARDQPQQVRLESARDRRGTAQAGRRGRGRTKWSDKLALWQARWHMQNWLDCIRSRKRPVADVEIGHRSISVCHLANIARAVGRPLRWDPPTSTLSATKRPTAISSGRDARALSCRPSEPHGWHWRLVRQCLRQRVKGTLADEPPVPPEDCHPTAVPPDREPTSVESSGPPSMSDIADFHLIWRWTSPPTRCFPRRNWRRSPVLAR